MMEKRLTDIILKVQSLKSDNKSLEIEVSVLRQQVNELKVALETSKNTIEQNTKQNGDEDQQSQVKTSINTASNASSMSSSTVDTAQLKIQIADAIEDIDQCIQIISADK